VIEPFLPRNQPGPERVDDRRIIAGILHVLTYGCRWRDGPAESGPRTAVRERVNRWSRRGFRRGMLAAPARRIARRAAATYGPPRPQVALVPLI
jgi:transposase